MLSRIAESLFWIGRYVERGDGTARLLDVQFHAGLQGGRDAAARRVLDVMGVLPVGQTAPSTVRLVELLAYDTANPSSIVSSVAAARSAAQSAREALSAEMWECLNATQLGIEARIREARDVGPHHLFEWVRERAALLWGFAEATQSRDEGWRFLVLGRSLERADMTARLLAATLAVSPSSAGWVTALRSCSAHTAYLQAFRRPADAVGVVEFLLLDALFPRSVRRSLVEAETALGALSGAPDRRSMGDEALRLVGRARTTLEFVARDALLDDLVDVLASIQEAIGGASDATAQRFFRRGPIDEWRPQAKAGAR